MSSVTVCSLSGLDTDGFEDACFVGIELDPFACFDSLHVVTSEFGAFTDLFRPLVCSFIHRSPDRLILFGFFDKGCLADDRLVFLRALSLVL